MNRAEQAQKGFKTFLLTLSISLIVFSAIYYAITNSGNSAGNAPDIESETEVGATPETVFNKLANEKITDVPQRAVLAAEDEQLEMQEVAVATEPTQSTGTPQGGVVSITVGLFTSLAVFLFGMFVIAKDPRRLALQRFERTITKDLE